MRVLVYGLGRSGLAAARLCLRQGHDVAFYEARADGPDIAELERLGVPRTRDPVAAGAGVCIAAPGVPIGHPDLEALRRAGTEVIGEVEWVYRTVDADLVGITGTAGKGTVTSWLSHALDLAGIPARAGGNLDPALSAVAEPGHWLVTELSSFQLERCPTLRPRVAILLNLGEDHLDRHGTVAAYHAAKRNLLANLRPEDLLVYNRDDPTVREWARACPARGAGFSLAAAADAHLREDGTLVLGPDELLPAAELGVPGRHNQANALAVALAARELGVGLGPLREALRGFRGLPGRYGYAGRLGNIRFVADSIATRPLAVAAALEATPAPLVWIAGGRSKGADIAAFEELLREKVLLFVGIGEAGPEFCRAVSDWVPTHLCPQRSGAAALDCALRAAVSHLRAHAPRGGTVLLAPLAASFDQFTDYRDRAEAFRAAIARLEATWTRSW